MSLAVVSLLFTPAMVMVKSQATKLVFQSPSPAVARKYVYCGTKGGLLSDGAKGLLPLGLPYLRWKFLVEQAAGEAGVTGNSANWMFTAADGKPSSIVAAVLPEACSRHASPVRPHSVTALLKSSASKSADVIFVLDDVAHAGGTACAIGRAFPTYSAKTRGAPPPAAAENGKQEAVEPPTVRIGFATREGAVEEDASYESYASAAEGVRRAARLVDLPPDVLTSTAFVGEAMSAAERLERKGHKIECSVLSGEALRDGGYGFLYGVGKAAEEPPALVVLSSVPSESSKTVCLVGKGE